MAVLCRVKGAFGMNVVTRRYWSLLVLALCLGCGDGKTKLPTAPVTGVVMYRGKPLTVGKVVFFHPTGQAASGDLSDVGAFEMTAFQGSNQVAIVSFGPDRPNPIINGFPPTVPGESLVPRHYTEARTSGLTFDVKSEDNVAKFELKD
jgi:hypothetical protein